MISVKCPKPNCHNHTQVNEIFIGRPVRCSKCGLSFVIKAPPPAPRSAPKPAAPILLPVLLAMPPDSAGAPPFEAAACETQPLSELEFPETEWIEAEAVTELDSGGWPALPMLDDLEPDLMAADGATVEPLTATDAAETSEAEPIRPKRGERRQSEETPRAENQSQL